MHLTPRTLLLAAGATLTACTFVGVIGTLDRPAAPTAGGGIVTEPTQSPSTPQVPSFLESPETTVPAPLPTLPPADESTPPQLASAPAATSRGANDQRGEGSAAAPATKPAPRDTTPALPTPPQSAPTPRRTVVTSSWVPPALHFGITTITSPRLSSRALVWVTVACSPGSGCSMSGLRLHIQPGTDATVTWSARARPGYSAWSVSRHV